MGQIAGEAFVQQGDGLQLLAPDLPRSAHVPALDLRRAFRWRRGLAAAAGGAHQRVDFGLIENLFHGYQLSLRSVILICTYLFALTSAMTHSPPPAAAVRAWAAPGPIICSRRERRRTTASE